MSVGDLAAGTVYFLQTVIGVVGNSSLLYHRLVLYFTGYRLRPTDLIINNLIVANIFVLLFSGLFYSMSSFGWYNVYNDLGCKFFYYACAVGRGVSIGTTCLLSIIQAVTICPLNSRWAGLKHKAPKYIVPTIFLCWILQMLVNVIYATFVTSNPSNQNITSIKTFGYCSSVRHDKMRDSLYAALITFPDVVCFVLMLWTSGSMVFILYRHKQRVRHVHRTRLFPRSCPESRATKTILLLVSTFVLLNTLSAIFHVILAVLNNPNLFILRSSAALSLSFPTVSPFLILSRDSSVSRVSLAWLRNIKFPNVTRKM